MLISWLIIYFSVLITALKTIMANHIPATEWRHIIGWVCESRNDARISVVDLFSYSINREKLAF